jgi:hypothetical protein
MTIDRYTKAVLTVIAVALVVIAARPYFPASIWPSALQVAPAQAQSMAAREATIPKAWGKYVPTAAAISSWRVPTTRSASSTSTASRRSIRS